MAALVCSEYRTSTATARRAVEHIARVTAISPALLLCRPGRLLLVCAESTLWIEEIQQHAHYLAYRLALAISTKLLQGYCVRAAVCHRELHTVELRKG